MKITFDRDTLLAALFPAAGIVPGRNMSTGTDGVLFECSSDTPDSCILSVYDLEKGMRTTIEATVFEGGSLSSILRRSSKSCALSPRATW